MEYRITAVQAIDGALNSLRVIIAEAAAAGAFSEVAILARAAESLQIVSNELHPAHASAGLSAARTGVAEPTPVLSMRRSEPAAFSVAATSTGRQSYPQYFRDGERLVKRAWSKKDRQPYEHKAPHQVIDALLNAIRKARGDQRPFEAADIMPLQRETGEEYPSYQAYLALGWLRHVGAIAKGREGYLLKRDWNAERIAQTWGALSSVA